MNVAAWSLTAVPGRAGALTLFERQFYCEAMEELRGPLWTVGARHGDADGGVWRKSFDRESAARALVDRMMERNGGRKAWVDMTSLVHDSPRRGRAADQVAESGDGTIGGRRPAHVDHVWEPRLQ
jgi:hypothetical protein